jgi:glycosyltransferase involved in cell wall biosynthesis
VPLERVINVIDNVSALNIGLWQPILAVSGYFSEKGVITEIWSFQSQDDGQNKLFLENAKVKFLLVTKLPPFTKKKGLRFLEKEKIFPKNTLVVTHGTWRAPTWWGHFFAKMGFTWVYTPHGMLEPWSMAQKKGVKIPYFHIVEKQLVSRAKALRAVSELEADTLKRLFQKMPIKSVPNAIFLPKSVPNIGAGKTRRVVFLGRLHPKKGVRQLTEAWVSSSLNDSDDYELQIVGPDEGEGSNIAPFVRKSSNLFYSGPLYGAEKERLLASAQFFVLPSMSEGLPSALLEALSFGLVPIISRGCNLPSIFEADLAIEVVQDTASIKKALDNLPKIDDNTLDLWRKQLTGFSKKHYAPEKTSKQLLDFYRHIHIGRID